MFKKDKHYMSSIDKALREFETKHPLSQEQIEEISKYQSIYDKRDNIIKKTFKDKGFEHFLDQE